MQFPLCVGCSPLTVDDVARVARDAVPVALADHTRAVLGSSRAVVDDILKEGRVVYGVNTGFGRLADRVIPPDSVLDLQRNLLLSHSVGVGAPLSTDVVRAMMLLRVAALAKGYSGVRFETVSTLVEMLNRDVIPVIPSRGSVGASGDLAPLAHLALVLIGKGEAWFGGRRLPGDEAMQQAGLEPVELGAKEGLALINGTQLMAAIGALLCVDAEMTAEAADIAGALSLEAVRGSNRPFDARIQEVRPHPGQVAVAAHLRSLTEGSEVMVSHRHDAHKVQDPYSFRCMPQVHGAVRDALAYLRRVVEVELNSATDNPLVFADGDVISGGNFHGEPLALSLDFAAIGIAELGGISERRVEAMLDPMFSELPPFLTLHSGVDSGFMVSQYTAAALASENKVLSHPASVDSIPTSANQEDHVSMGATAALKARDVLHNVQTILAIELLCAAEGLDYRRPLRSTPQLERVHALIRSHVPHLDTDRVLAPDIAVVTDLVRAGAITDAARERAHA